MKFPRFSEYAFIGDSVSIDQDGLTITARLEFDAESHIDDDDAHNTDRGVTGCSAYQQGKLLAARRAWKQDEWCYVTIILSASKKGVMLSDYAGCLSGCELNYPDSDNSYLSEQADEMLQEAIEVGKEVLESLFT